MTQGTPKDLKQAIENGIMEAVAGELFPVEREVVVGSIDKHVRDYLAQKFTAAFLENARDLWTMRALNKLVEAVGLIK